MSIKDTVRALVNDGRLYDRPSSIVGLGPRSVYVTADIDGRTRKPFANTDEGLRFMEAANYLDAFVEYNDITVSEDPRSKPRDVMLARVESDHGSYWSMRIVDPPDTAGMRLLGGFVGRDEFVAVMWDYRELMDFGASVDELAEVWRDYFDQWPPLQGESLDDLLTNYTRY